MNAPVDLDDGESFDFTFGSLELPLYTLDNNGSFNLGIQLSSPDFSGSVQNGGSFKDVWSLGGIISGGALYFGGPVSFGYDYNGTPGVMTLALADLSGIQWGKMVDITGTITNSVAPAPEPTAILIMGAGLLGITLVSRKQLKIKK